MVVGKLQGCRDGTQPVQDGRVVSRHTIPKADVNRQGMCDHYREDPLKSRMLRNTLPMPVSLGWVGVVACSYC